MDYNELYEVLRKEKYSDQLQSLPKDFVEQAGEFFKEKRESFSVIEGDLFSDSALRNKKQFENSKAIFKELMLRRKKKILNLVFVAAETGIMKRDFGNMLGFEQELFEELVVAVESGDKKLRDLINGKKEEEIKHKLVVLKEDVGEMVDMNGQTVGPFKKGQLINLDSEVAGVLVQGEKADFIDE
ncbi:hypothetical protein CO038_02480 [Candidatus Pacearchaeota archaeon CG_4_9_14_0_2_um_filter_39_13]|nr:DNA replication complex GINS family protein [Candidatus Pacearchaeota archaeon]OIO43953.1 MAG: hypothetical protein AUJ64_01535 [Candidatus Pacearchaeota archaeon CG1_02_39_14]PJC44806.1 MAG: hypothetical protein CO038_02480 [Candidatus Pacearchaeota archaeon CG_4_9_14_0_2_um_filter_39_13]